MDKIILPAFLLVLLMMFSCTEVPVHIDRGDFFDTTYTIERMPEKQVKNYLVEELAGVQCVNCPAGMAVLKGLNDEGDFRGKLHIVSIHVGPFAKQKEGISIQDLVTDEAEELVSFLGGYGGQPCAAFDRHPLGEQQMLFVGKYDEWGATIRSAESRRSNTPVNIELHSKYNPESMKYDIIARVIYTENITAPHSLSIYITEDNINEPMIYPFMVDTAYVFDYIMRDMVTPLRGRPILTDFDTKEAGRVYEYRTSIKIDTTTEYQKYWKIENINIVAFVHHNSGNDKSVYQTMTIPLEQK